MKKVTINYYAHKVAFIIAFVAALALGIGAFALVLPLMEDSLFVQDNFMVALAFFTAPPMIAAAVVFTLYVLPGCPMCKARVEQRSVPLDALHNRVKRTWHCTECDWKSMSTIDG